MPSTTHIAERVTQCFQSVFPGLGTAQAREASQGTLAQWDSVAHVTLLAALGEEFELDFDEEAYESLTSYPRIVEHVQQATGG